MLCSTFLCTIELLGLNKLLYFADQVDVNVNPSTVTDPSAKARTTLADMLGELMDDSDGDDVAPEVQTKTDKEINLYSSLPRIMSSASPLVWWQSHRETFPYLARLARKYLCIQATSVSSERVFSAAGNIVTNKRNCLKPSKVNQLCFLAANLD